MLGLLKARGLQYERGTKCLTKVLAQNVKQRPTRIARSVARRSITVAFSPASRGVSDMDSFTVQQQDPNKGYMFATVYKSASKSDAVAYRKLLDGKSANEGVVVKTLILHTIERVLSDEEMI